MPIDLAAHVAIIQDGRILLTKRDDVAAWVLPGGQVDAGESAAEAAVREAREETGLEVRLTRMVGIYFISGGPGGDNHTVLFAAEPIGGVLRPQAGEVIEVRYCEPAALPEPLVWWHRQRIHDALRGAGGGVVWRQNAAWALEEGVTWPAIFQQWAQSGLSEEEFFGRHFARPVPEPEGLEVLQVAQ